MLNYRMHSGKDGQNGRAYTFDKFNLFNSEYDEYFS